MRNFEDYFDAIRRGFRQVEAQNGVIYVQAAQLADTGMVRHGFTSRIGGISQGALRRLESIMEPDQQRGGNPAERGPLPVRPWRSSPDDLGGGQRGYMG